MMTIKEFREIIEESKYLGSGISRAAFLMPDGNVLKTYKNYDNSEIYLAVPSIEFLQNNLETIHDMDTSYFNFLKQQLTEIEIWKKTKSELLLPVLKWGYVENGLLYEIVPFVTMYEAWTEEELEAISYGVTELEIIFGQYFKEGSFELFSDFCNKLNDFEEQYGYSPCDIYESGTNAGFWNNKIVITDYGMFI